MLLGAGTLALLSALTHPRGAIISFDEGFHGGAALFFQEMARYLLHIIPNSPRYLESEFANGVTLYPPLWTLLASFLGFIFGPSTAIYRAATLVFYVFGIILSYGFVRTIRKSIPAGVGAALLFATTPMIFIYSHLMMLEVPLLVSTMAMIFGFYLYTKGIIRRRARNIIILTLVFAVAPLAKLPELPVAWVIIAGYIVASSVLFWRQRFYRRFLKPELALFFIVSFIPLALYIALVKHYLHVDMIDFFIGQSNEGANKSPLLYLIYLSWTHRDFYLRDFLHMPTLSLVWLISLIGYAVWKRSALSLLLVVWAVGIYFAFSGVSPQVPQYIMPIYAPLALAVALFVYDLIMLLRTPFKWHIFTVTLVLLVMLQINAIPKSEGYGWRTKITGQEQTAQWIADHANQGDRVITWHDGTFYAIRLAGLSQRLQIMHGGPTICAQGLRDSIEWVTEINEPPLTEPEYDAILKQAPWQEVQRFGQGVAATALYHNPELTKPMTIEAETYDGARTITDANASHGYALTIAETDSQPAIWGCLRSLPFGQDRITFRIKTLSLPSHTSDDDDILRLEYDGYPGGEYTSRVVKAKELRQSNDYQSFSFTTHHTAMDRPGEFRIFMFRPARLAVDTITISPDE